MFLVRPILMGPTVSSPRKKVAPSKILFSTYTLIPTVYRALLTSAVSGIGHRIHTTKRIRRDQCVRTKVSLQNMSAGVGYACRKYCITTGAGCVLTYCRLSVVRKSEAELRSN